MTRIFNKLIKLLAFIKNYRRIESLSVSSVFIGKGTRVQKYSSVDSQTKIGDYCYIGVNTHITKAKIGNYCSIANNVSIGHGEHDLNKISTSTVFYDDTYNQLTKKECVIGHDVWIGVDSVILRGVRVGTGAVVGANSVVTKDVPDYAVVVGSPARVIKYRFDEVSIQLILDSKWWELEPKDAKEVIGKLENRVS